MSKDLEKTHPLPPAVKKVSSNLQRWGFWSFWLQLILGIIATVTLLFSTPVLFRRQDSLPGNQFGVLCAFLGIVLLAIAVVISFRYGRIGKKILKRDPAQRPKKSDTVQLVRIGLILNLVGMLFAIAGAQALVGISLSKSLEVAPGSIGNPSVQQFVTSFDILIIQANTNTIAAHFAGIVTSLILLNRIAR